jgi:hypothetical protein
VEDEETNVLLTRGGPPCIHAQRHDEVVAGDDLIGERALETSAALIDVDSPASM